MMLKIAIDANEANVAHRVGSNIYAYRLLCEIEQQTRAVEQDAGSLHQETKSVIQWTVLLSSPHVSDFPAEREGWKYQVVKPAKLWTQWRLPLYLFFHRKDFDGIVSLGHYAPRISPIPSIMCVLDLAFLQFPQFFRKKDLYQLTAWTAYSVKQAKHVVTISEQTKQDIVNQYGKDQKDISIVYPAVDIRDEKEQASEDPSALATFGLKEQEYLVSIGTIQPRKNMINLIKAYERWCEVEQQAGKAHPGKLVFVGKAGWLTKEFDDAVAASPQKSWLIVTGFISEAAKFTLLRHARCSVLVGFYEGFGIPVIESLSMGVIPVVANTGSLPEVAGDFGVYVDPYNIDSMARGLAQAYELTQDQMKRSQMRTRAASFSWEKSGEKLLDVIHDVFTKEEAI